jgi:hypothetical protein
MLLGKTTNSSKARQAHAECDPDQTQPPTSGGPRPLPARVELARDGQEEGFGLLGEQTEADCAEVSEDHHAHGARVRWGERPEQNQQ